MKKLTMPLVAVLVAMAIAAAYFWTQLGVERQQLAALQARVADMEKAQQAAAAVAAMAAAQAPVVSAAGAAAAPAAAGAKPGARKVASNIAEGVMALMSQPDVLRREMEREYPDLAKELDLSPAEVDKFYALMAKQATVSMGNALGLFSGGSGDSAALQESMRKQLEGELAAEKEMAAMLGARRNQQWQEYQGTMQARQQVELLRNMLGSGQNALSEAKAKPLIAALGYETARTNRETQAKLAADLRTSKNLLEDQLKYSSQNSQRLVNAAAPYLNAAQLDRYKQIAEQEEIMMRAMLGAGGKGTSAATNGAMR